MKNVLVVLFAAGMLGSIPLKANVVNLLTNGSFENPVGASGDFTEIPNGSTALTGWTVITQEIAQINPGCCNSGTLPIPASDGNYFLDLTGVFTSMGGVQQTV